MSKAAEANPADAFEFNSNVQEHSLPTANIAQPMGRVSSAQTRAHAFIQEWQASRVKRNAVTAACKVQNRAGRAMSNY